MEMACDAAVLAQAQTDIRTDYAQVLLRQAGGRALPFSPISFGMGDVKKRIESILRFEGARSRFAAVALLAVATLGLCLLVNPESDVGKTLDRSMTTQYKQAAVAYLPERTEITQSEPFRMAVGEDDSLFLYNPETGWNYAGQFEEIELTADELREAFRGDAANPAQWEPVDEETFIRSITGIRQCRVQTTQNSDYAKSLDDGTEEERQFEEPVMGIWTLFETVSGSEYIAYSALGNWDAQAQSVTEFLGADPVEWLGERPPSGWIGDARQPTVFFMFRMAEEWWNGHEMAQQELARALIAEYGAVPADWELVSSAQTWSMTTLEVYYSPSEQLWGVAQIRYIANAPEVYEVGLYPRDRHIVTVVETEVAVRDGTLFGVRTERAVIGCVLTWEDQIIAYEDMLGHPSLVQVKAEQPYVLSLNPEQDNYSFEYQAIDGMGTSGSMTIAAGS
ncbi:MAG: hypothetical protein IJ452_05240 [Butyricicoccus sp.]|nr:hypothetical protein [Butyricicoccus sp.]